MKWVIRSLDFVNVKDDHLSDSRNLNYEWRNIFFLANKTEIGSDIWLFFDQNEHEEQFLHDYCLYLWACVGLLHCWSKGWMFFVFLFKKVLGSGKNSIPWISWQSLYCFYQTDICIWSVWMDTWSGPSKKSVTP